MKLEIKNLSVTLDRQPILQDVSLEVRDGEFVSLLGPSGCGKSTMLKTIALVLVPYIQSGDRALASAYSVAFVGSAMIVFFIFEALIGKLQKGGEL